MSNRRRSVVARRLVLLVALVGAMLVVAAPATATSVSRVPTGPGIPFLGPTSFAANTPFHVQHGFVCDVGDAGCISTQINGNSGFNLYVDGVLQPSTLVVTGGTGGIAKLWLTNFPNGLPAGDHTLVGNWLMNGDIVQTRSITITFS